MYSENWLKQNRIRDQRNILFKIMFSLSFTISIFYGTYSALYIMGLNEISSLTVDLSFHFWLNYLQDCNVLTNDNCKNIADVPLTDSTVVVQFGFTYTLCQCSK